MWWAGLGDWFTRLGWLDSKRCRFDSAQRSYVFENRAEVNFFGGYIISLSTIITASLSQQFLCVLFRTFFRTIATDPYNFLHVIILRVSDTLAFCISQFLHDSHSTRSPRNVTRRLQSMHFTFVSRVLFSLPSFGKDFSNGFIHTFAKITASEATIAKPSDWVCQILLHFVNIRNG